MPVFIGFKELEITGSNIKDTIIIDISAVEPNKGTITIGNNTLNNELSNRLIRTTETLLKEDIKSEELNDDLRGLKPICKGYRKLITNFN